MGELYNHQRRNAYHNGVFGRRRRKPNNRNRVQRKTFGDPREVADTVRANYGFAGKRFVEWLEEESNIDRAKDILIITEKC